MGVNIGGPNLYNGVRYFILILNFVLLLKYSLLLHGLVVIHSLVKKKVIHQNGLHGNGGIVFMMIQKKIKMVIIIFRR